MTIKLRNMVINLHVKRRVFGKKQFSVIWNGTSKYNPTLKHGTFINLYGLGVIYERYEVRK